VPGVTEPAAVIFDLDGVLIDSETEWDSVRRELTERAGGSWRPEASRAMMGMSSVEWSRYMHDELAVPMGPQEVSDAVVRRLMERYRERLPLIDGAREAVMGLAQR
jgi:beta-phosphoglucomutase-like phosphatase (HAD superfamily)